ncbi:MAG: V-type ATP synthase subunit E, partial [Eubacteriales bacterium]|nr:V-type ATP synthase subunit E [Eubacteriales bacterium]
MDGIEAIVEHILADAREKAAQIEAGAAEQIDQIKTQADQACASIRQDADHKGQQAAAAVINRASSQAALEARRVLLEARQNLIDEVIADATHQLGELSDPEKKDLYVRMIQATGSSGGTVTANAADLALMQDVVAVLGKGWDLSTEPGTFSGGLSLSRGRIVENLTFDLLVRNLRPQLAALAAGI